MKPAAFTYHAPATLEEALALLAGHGADASLLAGGQSLVPMMNFRLAQPAVLIDLNRIADLSFVHEETPGEIRCGAMTRQRTLERDTLIRERLPLIHAAMPYIAHPPIRNRGTLGGSIAHADPAAELPALMLVHGARFRLQHTGGDRWIDATDFFEDLFQTAREPEEMLTEIAIPVPPAGTGWAFEEFARRHGDYALAGVAALVSLDDDGRCSEARIGLLSAGATPLLARKAVGVLVGEHPTNTLILEAAAVAADADIDPAGDLHASAEYRRHLVRVLTARALKRACKDR